jgi:AraC-like DNA-binding protein
VPIARLDIVARRHQRIAAAPFAEFAVVRVRAGCKRVEDGQRHAVIAAGEYLAVAPGQLLHVENQPPTDGPYRAVCLCVGHDLLGTFRTAAKPAPRAWASLPRTASLDQAFTHAERGLADGLPEALLQHRVAELVTAVVLSGFRPQWERTQSTRQRVRMLLADDPARAWRADEVAAHFATSGATLRRKLNDEGCSFRELLQEVRLAHGLVLIQASTKSLQQIAGECGYASPSRFSARFRERFGTMPSTLRN